MWGSSADQSSAEGEHQAEKWNDAVEEYIVATEWTTEERHRKPEAIGAAAKRCSRGGPLRKRCENPACGVVEGKQIEVDKLLRCTGCRKVGLLFPERVSVMTDASC